MTQSTNSDAIEKLIASLRERQDPRGHAATLLQLAESAGSQLWPVIEAMIESADVQERTAAVVAAEKTRHLNLEDRIAMELTSDHARLAGAAAHAIGVFSDLRDQAMVATMLSKLDCDT
jgi:hypothetical protein